MNLRKVNAKALWDSFSNKNDLGEIICYINKQPHHLSGKTKEGDFIFTNEFRGVSFLSEDQIVMVPVEYQPKIECQKQRLSDEYIKLQTEFANFQKFMNMKITGGVQLLTLMINSYPLESLTYKALSEMKEFIIQTFFTKGVNHDFISSFKEFYTEAERAILFEIASAETLVALQEKRKGFPMVVRNVHNGRVISLKCARESSNGEIVFESDEELFNHKNKTYNGTSKLWVLVPLEEELKNA